MKKFIVPIISLIIIILCLIYLDPITDTLAKLITKENEVTIEKDNGYSKKLSYGYVQYTKNFIPYSKQDIINIFYTIIDNGGQQFTFYCPKEYTSCIDDVSSISGDKLILTHLNNYVHTFNSFTNIKTVILPSGEVNIKIYYLYNLAEIKKINEEVDKVIKDNIKDNMSDEEKIKVIHDYIINNTKYDVERNLTGVSEYDSHKATGPLFQGYATCNGYTDLMAIYLSKMGFNNIKIATTPDDLNGSESGHIWNAVYLNGEWLHLDLTWDDPVSQDNKDYLFHTYFLVTTDKMKEEDSGETTIEEHNFNKLFYLEFK